MNLFIKASQSANNQHLEQTILFNDISYCEDDSDLQKKQLQTTSEKQFQLKCRIINDMHQAYKILDTAAVIDHAMQAQKDTIRSLWMQQQSLIKFIVDQE
ncbi:Hypothetical_protein [Hexamita inflata]|uniref:Hypothetical_protein n=1 Tax=Hexamita inflata TaxID=28002 RepID=A0AA86N562_9EUKA|nr:Hypothetical protein HINF_LOCUS409 [Hexamita inflata]